MMPNLDQASDSLAPTARLLGYGGLLPFVALVGVTFTGSPDWVERLLLGYGVVILAFLAGSMWLRQLLAERAHPRLLIASNALALIAWPAIIMPLHWGALWLAMSFGAHLLLDQPWQAHGLPGWYRRLRLILSGLVIGLLTLTWLIETGRAL